jgi:DNA helicase II / ATP-dependent DNA helicase PcrA
MKRYLIKRPKGADADRLARYRADLNEEQFKVVTAPPGATLVVAGAGSGKTRAITYRVAYLIEQGVSPARIMLATFTNRAAREMLRRVEMLTSGGDVRRVWGGTFHRIANLVLRRHASSLGYEANYTILDAEDARDFLNTCVDEAGIDTKARRFPRAEVLQDIISYANNTDRPLNEVVPRTHPHFEPLVQQMMRVDSIYMERKRERNVMDYDDLLLNWKRLLLLKPEIAGIYADQFQHILVDEYQDTNKLQAEIIDLLAVKHRNVMVVGDDAQSIFAWRGAEFTNIYEFPERYKDARVYRLETNYRSTPEILSLANASIACNRKQFPKTLRAARSSANGLNPALVPCRDADQQAAFIAARILELRDEGVALEEMAVLYRSHYHSLELQLELTRRGIPYRVRSGVRFFEQAHIKDVVAYLRVIVNPRDELAWKRMLRLVPQIGPATASRIWERLSSAPDPLALVRREDFQAAPKRGAGWSNFLSLMESLTRDETRAAPARQIELILDQGYAEHLASTYENAEARLEDLRQLAHYSARYNSTEEFLAELALLSTERYGVPQPVSSEDVVSGGEEDELLTLTSVHQAKGLEWRVVFIIWAADGKFPSPRALRDAEGEEEERRLWYVALTRAGDQLYLTYPLMITDYNRQTVLQKPSRFVTEVPPELYDIWTLEDEDVPSLPEPDEEDGGPRGYIN